MARLRPQDVFTPATPVRDDVFATRRHEHLQDRVEAVLGERGRQVVLFGLTGVGKTSLLRYLCRQRRIRYVRVECGGTFEETAREALGQVVGEEEIERLESQSSEAEFGATVWGFLTGKAKVGQGHAGADGEGTAEHREPGRRSVRAARLPGAVPRQLRERHRDARGGDDARDRGDAEAVLRPQHRRRRGREDRRRRNPDGLGAAHQLG